MLVKIGESWVRADEVVHIGPYNDRFGCIIYYKNDSSPAKIPDVKPSEAAEVVNNALRDLWQLRREALYR